MTQVHEPASLLDEQSAGTFIQDLFHYVLDRNSTSVEEVRHWTEILLDSRDPIDVFRRFAMSKEKQAQLTLRQETRTLYPHGHFYSPVVRPAEIGMDKERVFRQRAPAVIELSLAGQEEFFRVLSRHFASLPFSDTPDDRHRYHYGNTSYGFGDACVYWGVLATLKPAKIIEIGSGFTSALALDAIEHFSLLTRCAFIDPYPELLQQVAAPIDQRHRVIAKPVQRIDPALVEELEENDLLFIDSSHVVKTGSDVHFAITEILPRLRPGVVVHFHDAFYPFEYPEDWVLRDNKSWNELYFLQSFLMYNSAYKIIFFNHCFARLRANCIEAMAPTLAARILLNPGGGLWLRRM